MRALPVLFSLLALLAFGAPSEAQLPSRLSEQATISLLTLAPGDEVHTIFGHGAIRVVDPRAGFDVSFNYGTFEFGDGFVAKFMYGELDYFLSVYPTQAAVDQAISKERSVVEQVFDLTSEERQDLYTALYRNAHPDNRTYRYDFLFDNCSTRVIDILRTALGPGLVMPSGPFEARSHRTLLDEHIVSAPWMKFGFALLLGSRVDRAATFEESWFLPRHLRVALDDASLNGKPFVSEVRVLFDSGRNDLRPAGFDLPTALCWALFVLAGLSVIRDTRGRLSRTLDGLLFGLVGAAGLFIAIMWGATLHHVMGNNWNLVWALPTHLVVALLLFRRNRPAWVRIYLGITALLAFVVALGFGIPQTLSPAILPIGLLLALRAAVNARRWPEFSAPDR